jgi:hypothetical protein
MRQLILQLTTYAGSNTNFLGHFEAWNRTPEELSALIEGRTNRSGD